MKKDFFALKLILAVLLVFTASPAVAAGSLIPDSNLERVIKEYLEIEEITEADLQNLYDIWAFEEGIASLSGLEKAVNLQQISLEYNEITDLTPLKDLSDLQGIELAGNTISNIDSLKNLTNLAWLGLAENNISNISALKNLKELSALDLTANNISDISALKDLNELSFIDLSANLISDVSPLDNLKIEGTGVINLSMNKIASINSLSSMTVGHAVYLNLGQNQLKSLDALKNINKLTRLNAEENQIESIVNLKTLTKLDDVDLSGNKLKSLEGLTVSNDVYGTYDFSDNQLTDITALSNVKYADINLTGNLITDLTPLKNMQGGSLFIMQNPLTSESEKIIKDLKARGVMVEYDAIVQREVERVSGVNRYSTATEISQEGWQTAETVVIARGDDFPDALAGASLAYKLDAPILLTGKDSLPQETIAELIRLKAKKVVILGGTGAVSAKVENALKGMNLGIERIAGKNRFETAKLIAAKLGGNPDTAIVAYGQDFPDALAVASYAATNGYPILLVNKNSTPAETKAMLTGIKKTIVVGGEGVISADVFKELPNAERIGGKNRFETAANLINTLGLATDKVFVANGRGFADALTGSVLAAKQNAPLLLVEKDKIPAETLKVLVNNGVKDVMILGGKSAVTEDISKYIQN